MRRASGGLQYALLGGRYSEHPVPPDSTLVCSRREVDEMAVYDFQCQACGERFQITAAMSEHDGLRDNPPACPKCAKRETRQLVSMFTCKTPSGY